MKLDSFHQLYENETQKNIVDSFNTRLVEEVDSAQAIVGGAVSIWYKEPEGESWIYAGTEEGDQSAIETGFDTILSGIYDPNRIITAGVTTIIE